MEFNGGRGTETEKIDLLSGFCFWQVLGMRTLSLHRFCLGLFVFLSGVVVVSAVLSPPVYFLIEQWEGARWPFKRIFNRVLMVGAVLGLPGLLWYLHAWSFSRIGWISTSTAWRGLWLGWGTGVVHLGLLALVHGLAGVRVWHWELDAGRMAGYFAAGWAVAIIEETIFRGGLFLALKQMPVRKLIAAGVIGSFVFAMAHFPAAREVPGPVSWNSGWAIWADLVDQFLNWQEVVRRGVGLFLVAMCLCAAAWRTGSLWFPAGLHAGWVFALKAVNRMTDNTRLSESLWWGGHPLDGAVAWLLLLVLLFLILFWRQVNVASSD